MADTTFSAGTVVASSWLNDVNDSVYITGFSSTKAPVNVMNFLTEAQQADVLARTLSLDLTAELQAAHNFANGRPVYYPLGSYKFSSLSLAKSGDGIVGDHSGGVAGEDGSLLVSTVTGTTAAVLLTTSYAHNVLFKDVTIKQQSGTIQGRGIVAADCYWLRTDNLRLMGFTDNLYCSLSIYHHHKRLLSEKSTNGVNYWGASGTWNTDWFNNVITFDTCRFSECTVTGISFKGCESVFISPDFTGMSSSGAIGIKILGESASFKAHGIKIITPYIENTKIAFSFLNSRVEIDGDGFVQGGASVGTQATSIIDADASQVLLSGLEDKDYWAFGYRLTNGSVLQQRVLFSGSIRATVGTTDSTSTFISLAQSKGTFTITLTGCTAIITDTASWEKRGNTVTLFIPALSGTSNTTAATLTGLPSEIQPATEQFTVANVFNNSVDVIGALRLFTSGTISLSAGVFSTAFTAAGLKGIRGTSFTYYV